MSATPTAVLEYRFARFRLLPHEQRLLFDDEAINVGPRAFSLLVVLVEHAGELVTKDAILSRVWPGLVVEENNIQVQISALRKILGHEAIVTIPGVGYRFVLPLATGVGASSGRSSLTEEPSNGPATHGPAGANPADRAEIRHSLPRRFRSTVPAVAAAVLAIVTVALWLSRDSLGPAPRSVSSPPAMSIAVLPFAAPNGGAIEQGLSEALSRDLPAVLARTTRYARVTSPDLTAAYAGKPIDVRSLGRELNVRYLVVGEVRSVGEQIVLSAQLFDTSNAAHVMSERLAIEQARLARDRDSLLARLTLRLRAAARRAETRRFAGVPAPDATAEELTWHAGAVWSKDESTLKGALEARKWFDEALRRDPSLVRAMLGRERTLRYELYLNPRAERDRLLREMEEVTFRAVWTDADDPTVWMFRSFTLTAQRRWAAALEAIANAERLYRPVRGLPLLAEAQVRVLMGQPSTALPLVEQALATDLEESSDVADALFTRCQASLALGRYDDAIAACESAVGRYVFWGQHLYLLAAYALKGDVARAEAEKGRLLVLRPGVTIADAKSLGWSDEPDFLVQVEKHFLAGLRKAGLREQ